MFLMEISWNKENILRNPLTHADIKNPHNRITIAGIAYLSTEIDADITGGEGEIRTRETLSRPHAFQACAFNHSATSPYQILNQTIIQMLTLFFDASIF